MDLKKAKYILPNMCTLGSVFFGFYSILVTVKAEDASQLGLAAWLIAISMVLDGLDGRVARATNTQSAFGVQLDSLADAISFGVAPAFLVYTWGLESLGFWGIFIAFAYAACGIMRLARFNVTASASDGPSAFFQGLPIPLAAGGVISLVLAHTSLTGKMATSASWSVALITILLSGLMVSNVKYRTFKKLKNKKRAIIIAMLALVGLVVASVQYNPGLAFTALIAAYILFGMAESIIGLGKAGRARIRARRVRVRSDRRGVLEDEDEDELELDLDLDLDLDDED